MAQRLAFHYFPGSSGLHRWDARCKLAALLILTFGLLHMSAAPLGLFSILFVAASLLIRIPWRPLAREMRSWALFLLFLFALQAFFTPASDLSTRWLSSRSFAHLLPIPALIASWRLALVLAYATLFTFVTRPTALQEAVVWFLKPLPFLPARRIALMVALALRFFPLLFEQLDEIRTALHARGATRRRNPLIRTQWLLLPLFRNTLTRADDMAIALAARGYREDLPIALPRIRGRDAAALALFACAVFLSTAPFPEYVSTLWSSVR